MQLHHLFLLKLNIQILNVAGTFFLILHVQFQIVHFFHSSQERSHCGLLQGIFW